MKRNERWPKLVLDRFSHFVFGQPSYCCLCGALDEGDIGICDLCRERLARQVAWACQVCGIPLRPPLKLCGDCRINLYHFDMQRSCGIYRGHLKHAILKMKYGGERWLARPLGHLLSLRAECFSGVGLVVPVPLGVSSSKTRGFNQAKDLAQEVAFNNSLPLADILVRGEIGEHQSGLKRPGRWRNLKGSMRAIPSYRLGGTRVLVVDDVTTTGATLDEAARALKHAGAEKVFGITLARTLTL